MTSDGKIRKFLVEKQKMTPVFAEDYLDGLKQDQEKYQEFLEFVEKSSGE